DQLMHQHFRRELDDQLPAMPVTHRARWRMLALGGAAIAAAIAGILLMRPGMGTEKSTVAAASAPQVNYEMAWQTIDNGTVYLDPDTPMQAYVRQQVETTRWVDPATHATMEMSVPQRQIVLVGLNSY